MLKYTLNSNSLMIGTGMSYKAVIFDLDGTLLNTMDDIASASNQVLARNGLPTYPLSQYRYFIGRGLHRLAYQILPENMRSSELTDQFYNEILREYAANMNTYTKPYEGIPELLDALVAKEIRMSILSNKAHELMNEVVDSHFKKWNFEIVFGARKNVPTKPDPYSALEIIQIMGLHSQDIVYIGDTDVDMQTAKAAGFLAVGAVWGFRTKDELVANGADLIIETPTELLKLFD